MSTPPQVSLLVPFQKFNPGVAFNISGTISDVDNENVTLNVVLDSSNIFTKVYPTPQGNFSESINIGTITNGIHPILFDFVDASGNHVQFNYVVFKYSGGYAISKKLVTMKNITASKTAKEIIISAQYQGNIMVFYSIDNGATWNYGTLDTSITASCNSVKLQILLDTTGVLKAYGVGFI